MALPTATQKGRHLSITTPLGTDVLLAIGFAGIETVSQLFEYTVTCIASVKTTIAFDKLIGQNCTVKLEYPKSNRIRYFNGYCRGVKQSESDITWTHYKLELVPAIWPLTRVTHIRFFQQITVPDILKKILQGYDVEYKIQGTFKPRDYCVQYRETDFHFISRLMEEEGIYFYFKHDNGKHQMVIANTPAGHAEVVYQPSIMYKNVIQGQIHEEDLIHSWIKTQDLTSGKVTLWDHCFEMPGKNLEGTKPIANDVMVGQINHKLGHANGKMELYDYPGEYAQRFDGIAPGGSARKGDLDGIAPDGARTSEIKMQAEAARAMVLRGRSSCRQLCAGHKFTLKTLPSDPLQESMKPDGVYVVTSVEHHCTGPDEFASGGEQDFSFENTFEAIPYAVHYRPPRLTEKPTVMGCQTATVCGPAGEEIFTDEYSRVQVIFHWDREKKHSCWIRVGSPWAGRGWGMLHIPRIGQEVIVDFLEGDPDQPIIVGSVYNAGQMPGYKLPDNKTMSYLKSNSSLGGVGYNEIRFEDKKSSEQIFMHGEKNLDIRIENDAMEYIIHDRHLIVGKSNEGSKIGSQFEEVYINKDLKVHKNHTEHIGGDMQLMVGGIDGPGNQDIVIKKDKKEHIDGDSHLDIGGSFFTTIGSNYDLKVGKDYKESYGKSVSTMIGKANNVDIGEAQSISVGKDQMVKIGKSQSLDVGMEQMIKVGKSYSLDVGQDRDEKVGKKFAVEAGDEIHLKAGSKIIIEAGSQISLIAPGGFVDISESGVTIQGTIVLINSGGSSGEGSGASPQSPESPETAEEAKEAKKAAEAKPKEPKVADNSVTGQKSCD